MVQVDLEPRTGGIDIMSITVLIEERWGSYYPEYGCSVTVEALLSSRAGHESLKGRRRQVVGASFLGV